MIPPDSQFVYALGWALVHFVWQGAALALVVRAAMAVLARRPANVRYVVACAGLAAMAIAPAATALMVSGPVPGTGVTVLVPAGEAVGVPAAAPPASMTEAPPPAPSGAVRTSQLAALVEKWLGTIVVVWLVGVAAVSAVYLGGWVRVRRLVRRRVFPALERWERVAAELGRRMRVSRPVRCLESAAVGVPTLIGCLKPVILVPAGLATGLAPEEVEALLAHELAHVRRWDYLANMVQTAVETLLFYHPAVWWLSGRIRAEREQCCDEIVVATCGNRAAYARALAALADSQAVARPALAARGGRLLERIRRILAMQAERQGAVRWLAGSASLVGIAAVLVTALAMTFCGCSTEGRTVQVGANATVAGAQAAAPSVDPARGQVLVETRFVKIKGGPLSLVLDGTADGGGPRKLEMPGTPTPVWLSTADMEQVLKALEASPRTWMLSPEPMLCFDNLEGRVSLGFEGPPPEDWEFTVTPHIGGDGQSVRLDWRLAISGRGESGKPQSGWTGFRLESQGTVSLPNDGAVVLAAGNKPETRPDPATSDSDKGAVVLLLRTKFGAPAAPPAGAAPTPAAPSRPTPAALPDAGQKPLTPAAPRRLPIPAALPAADPPPLTPEDEKRLRETQQLLEKDIDVDFEQTSRADILKFLSGASGANIVVSPDVEVVMDGAEGLKPVINVHIKRVAIKHVLRIVLGEQFTYEVGPGYVLVKMKV